MGSLSAQDIFDISTFFLGVWLACKVAADTRGRDLEFHRKCITWILLPCLVFGLMGMSSVPQLEDIYISNLNIIDITTIIGVYYFIQIYDIFSTILVAVFMIRGIKFYISYKKGEHIKSEEKDDKKNN